MSFFFTHSIFSSPSTADSAVLNNGMPADVTQNLTSEASELLITKFFSVCGCYICLFNIKTGRISI